jgi:hypothetical protein
MDSSSPSYLSFWHQLGRKFVVDLTTNGLMYWFHSQRDGGSVDQDKQVTEENTTTKAMWKKYCMIVVFSYGFEQ